MGRPSGRKNADHDGSRAALVSSMADFVLFHGPPHPTLQALADAASVTTSTLRHYFVDRSGLMVALVRHLTTLGAQHIADAATRPIDDVDASLRWFLDFAVEGWRQGLSRIHALGLTEGLSVPEVGHAYVDGVLEPTLQSAEARLARHVANGDLAPCDLRLAALQLVSPLLLALLHQDALDGRTCRPLDLASFVPAHLATWLAGRRTKSATACIQK